MSGGIFLIQNDGDLVEMNEKRYDLEDDLQSLLAKYPNLLAGNQIDASSPRRWLLIKREMAIPGEQDGGGRWSVDHLFLDQDAIPTLVEVKRSSDTRLRREVVGQLLEYAANAVTYWPADGMVAQYEQRCKQEGVDATQRLIDFLREESQPDEFWQKARENLQSGKVRLLFVADEISSELRRIVEFLNGQMTRAEVLAVEIKQFVTGDGRTRTLVPRVIGQTVEAEAVKGGAHAPRQWDKESFLEQLESERGADEAAIAKAIIVAAESVGCDVSFGTGATYGSCRLLGRNSKFNDKVAVIWTNGYVNVHFNTLRKGPPFEDVSKRLELVSRLNCVPGIEIANDRIEKLPGIPLSTFKSRAVLDQFLGVLTWVVEEINKA